MLLAVLFFRSFYGSSDPGTPPHRDSIPSNPLRPPDRSHTTRSTLGSARAEIGRQFQRCRANLIAANLVISLQQFEQIFLVRMAEGKSVQENLLLKPAKFGLLLARWHRKDNVLCLRPL